MGRAASESMSSLIQDILKTRVEGIYIQDSEGVILKTCEIDAGLPEYSIVSGNCAMTIFTHETVNPSENTVEKLKKLITIYSYSPTESAASKVIASSKILENITGKKTLDEILHQLVTSIILNGEFRRAGIMFLNEALLELRGVIYCNYDMKIDVTAFRNSKLSFKTKNVLSDVMFYEDTKLVESAEIDGFSDFSKYFCGNMLVTGLGIGGHPIGLLVVCKERYTRADKESAKLFGNICSMAIEFYRTKKQLELIQSELHDLKNADSNKDNLLKIGSMSATVAHELKNPLIAIDGFLDRLEQESADINHEHLSIIRTEVGHLERIVGDILSYSRRAELECASVCLKELIDEIIYVLNAGKTLSKINTVVNVKDALYVYVDKDKFRQVLMNLIINAVQEMPDGGDVIITAAESNKRITISVADTGSGIPAEVMEKIFEPFFTKKRNGTGLGLPLCKKIMLAHGGDIFVSDSNKGAVFTLLLPKKGTGNGENDSDN